MSKDRTQIRMITNDKNEGIYQAQFWDLMETGKSKPPRIYLCSVIDAEYKKTSNSKKKRTEKEKQNYLLKLYEQKHDVAKRKKEQKKQPVEELNHNRMMFEVFEFFTKVLKKKIERKQKSPDTLRKYNDSIRYYKKYVGDHPCERRYFSDEQISKFLNGMQLSGCGERSQYSHCITIKTILKWGYKQFDKEGLSYIKESIDFDIPKKPKSKPILYSEQEISLLEGRIISDYTALHNELLLKRSEETAANRILNDLTSLYNLYKAFVLVKNTAMRVGEVWSLNYDNILLEKGLIIIQDSDVRIRTRLNGKYEVIEKRWEAKGNKTRRIIDISKNDFLMNFIADDIQAKPSEEKFFLGNGKGVLTFCDTGKLTRKLKKYIDLLSITLVKPFHALRARGITTLLAQGYPIPRVQDMVGHEDVATTIGYYNMMENSSDELVAALGKDNLKTIKNELNFYNVLSST